MKDRSVCKTCQQKGAPEYNLHPHHKTPDEPLILELNLLFECANPHIRFCFHNNNHEKWLSTSQSDPPKVAHP